MISIGNAIFVEEEKIEESILPYYDDVKFNEPLLKEYPNLRELEKYLYIPPSMIPGKLDRERISLISDGGRSGINLNYRVEISLEIFGFHGTQTFVEGRKGVGSRFWSNSEKEKLENYWSERGERKRIQKLLSSPETSRVMYGVSSGYDRPWGAQSESLAEHELKESERILKDRINIKHCPVVAILRLPKEVEKLGRLLGNETPERFYQVIRLVPGNIGIDGLWTPSLLNLNDYEIETLKRKLEENGGVERFKKYILDDMVSLLELIPRTAKQIGNDYEAYAITGYFGDDHVVTLTGLYLRDMESIGFEKGYNNIKKGFTSQAMQIIGGIELIFLILKLGDWKEIIDKIDSSEYFKIKETYFGRIMDVEGEDGFRTNIYLPRSLF